MASVNNIPRFSQHSRSISNAPRLHRRRGNLDEFLDDFPTVTREAAVHALEHAKALVVNELR
jgi:hypothetical protein